VATHNALASALKTEKSYVKAVEPVHEDIVAWVEDAHKEWLTNKNGWREIVFATQADADSIIGDARRYTNELRKVPLTIMTNGPAEATKDGVKVVYRVRSKTRAGRPPNGSSPAPAPTPAPAAS
jgi:hypothetical protein